MTTSKRPTPAKRDGKFEVSVAITVTATYVVDATNDAAAIDRAHDRLLENVRRAGFDTVSGQDVDGYPYVQRLARRSEP